MIYLKKFNLLTGDLCRESSATIQAWKTEDEYYPAYVFSKIELNQIDFEDITIFYGSNGSGKSSLLNTISEKLAIPRKREFVQTDFFRQYLSESCRFETIEEYDKIQQNNKFLASDDVFGHIFSIQEENKAIKSHKTEEDNYFR